MIEFAVHHESMQEDTGQWVLTVDSAGERLLLAEPDGSLVWYPIAECRLFKALTPDLPRMVVAIQPQQQNGLVMPEPNRQMRRNGHL